MTDIMLVVGQLREAETGNEFQYDVYEGDTERNDKRYEEIAQVVCFVTLRLCMSLTCSFTSRPDC